MVKLEHVLPPDISYLSDVNFRTFIPSGLVGRTGNQNQNRSFSRGGFGQRNRFSGAFGQRERNRSRDSFGFRESYRGDLYRGPRSREPYGRNFEGDM